jgi:endonuclease YncB( thermonuclease family)
VATCEVPQDIAEAILRANECRPLVPGVIVSLLRQQLWKGWADSSKGAEASKVVPARFLEVVDGDTIRVALGEVVEKVRYIGVDTPETNHPTRAWNQRAERPKR